MTRLAIRKVFVLRLLSVELCNQLIAISDLNYKTDNASPMNKFALSVIFLHDFLVLVNVNLPGKSRVKQLYVKQLCRLGRNLL